ncbi:hypothetical protein PBY51_018204 [Eleginops maclovinus]|uniref:Uncharacterized protein n=1 Tax=Eleginops maclovinus TaxID=56733 RepID=A0AAN7XGH5_ELEMC|nr:hypothetical protein PBY51_018204 [Eleginops maclovinus]
MRMQQTGSPFISLKNSSSRKKRAQRREGRAGRRMEIAKSEVIHHSIHMHLPKKPRSIEGPQHFTKPTLQLT